MRANGPNQNPNLHGAEGIIPEPIIERPNEVVENIYPLPGSFDVSDVSSALLMKAYLVDRLRPDDPGTRTRIVLAETPGSWPAIVRFPTGVKEVSRLRKLEEWFVSPRLAASIMVGSLAASVAVPAMKDAYDEVQQGAHKIQRIIDPLEPYTVYDERERIERGSPTSVVMELGSRNAAGSATVNNEKIKKFMGRAKVIRDRGGKLIDVKIVAESSDEFGSDDTIGRKEPPSQDFADERGAALKQELTSRFTALGVELPPAIRVFTDQDVLTLSEKRAVRKLAEEEGFPTIVSAIAAVERGVQVDDKLREAITEQFTDERGTTVEAVFEEPGKDVVITEQIPREVMPEDNPPADPDRDYNPWFIPMIPIRKREWVKEWRDTHKWGIIRRKPRIVPVAIHEDAEHAWVRLRPEAEQADGTLVEHPWSQTRKFEHLLRDDRIKNVLRADYKDAEGADTSLRVMFVDKSPAPATVEAFSHVLQRLAAAQGGRMGDIITGFFVYPQSSTGVEHRNPRKIALGVDKQEGKNILGQCTPLLELIELQMTETLDPEELEQVLGDFFGPVYTLAHEATHATDVTDEKIVLRAVRAYGIPNARIPLNGSWGDGLGVEGETLRPLLDRDPNIDPVQFDVTYKVVDGFGEIVTVSERVTENDPRLAHADSVTIVSHQPSKYAGTHYLEHSAETGAPLITGIPIPFSEADVQVDQLQTDSGQQAAFATGYRPANITQERFVKNVGAIEGTNPVEFENAPEVLLSITTAEDDPLLRQEMIRARKNRILRPDEMVSILATIKSRQNTNR